MRDAEEFFLRVAQVAGSDPKIASRLASRWEVFAPADLALALRARAVGERARGLWLRSAETLRLASKAAKTPRLALTYSIGRVDSLARAGRPADAVRLGRRLARDLTRMGESTDAARAHLNTANALLWSDKYTEASRVLHLAMPHLSGVEAAAGTLALSTAELFGGSAAAALRRAKEAEKQLEGLGQAHYARLARLNQGYALALTGQVEAGLSILREDGGLDEDPRTAELLSDVYRSCGLLDESIHAGTVALRGAKGLNRADVHLGLGLSLAQAGKWTLAGRRFRLAAAGFRRVGNHVWLAYARSRAAIARLHLDGGGLAALRQATQVLGKAKARRLYAECVLDLAEWEAQQGVLPQGRLVECKSAVHRLGDPALDWRWTAIRARVEGSPALFSAALDALATHRDRLASPILRSAFMRGREGLLGEFVQALAQREDSGGEAIQAVRKHRAIGLAEDIGALRAGMLPKRLSKTIARLRVAFAESEGSDPRRPTKSTPAELALQTEWSETHLSLRRTSGKFLEETPEPDIAWVESVSETYVLSGKTITTLPLGREDVARRLRALRFEIAGAALGESLDPGPALAAIRDLGRLLPPGLPQRHLCPEGQLWRVPWAALTSPNEEPIMALAPFAPGTPRPLPQNARVLLWTSDWDDLPYLRDETDLLLKTFPHAEVCRTLEQARRSLHGGDYDLCHVATHARAHPTSPLFSTISFPDGNLRAFEIQGSSARFGSVVLTACEAASVGGTNTFEPEGLGRAFLARGASVVIGPIWPLDDKAALVFVENLYQGLEAGQGWLEAVGAARAQVRQRMPHPYFWAPFSTLGGYGV